MKGRDFLLALLLASVILSFFYVGMYRSKCYQIFQITFNEWVVKKIYTDGIYDVTKENPKIYVQIAYDLANEEDMWGRKSFYPTGYYVVKEGDQYIAEGFIPSQSGWKTAYRPDPYPKTITITLPRGLEKGIHNFRIYLIQGSRGFWRVYDEYGRLRKTDTMTEIDAIKPYLKREPTEKDYKYGISFKTLWTEYIDWDKLIQAMEEHKEIDSLAYAYDNVSLLICYGVPNVENCGIKEVVYKEKIVYKDCRDIGCPEGFECKELDGNWVCVKEYGMLDYAPIIIGVILIVISVLVLLFVR